MSKEREEEDEEMENALTQNKYVMSFITVLCICVVVFVELPQTPEDDPQKR